MRVKLLDENDDAGVGDGFSVDAGVGGGIGGVDAGVGDVDGCLR